jgi:hypothetical protein
MALTTSTANELLNFYLRGTAITVPPAVYVSLHTANPGANGANEVTVANWPAYARQNASAGAANSTGWSAPANGVSNNAKQMLFPANDGVAEITVTHFCLWDAATGGRCLFAGALNSQRSIQPGDELVIYANRLTLNSVLGV